MSRKGGARMGDFVKVAGAGDIAPGTGKAVDVGARRIALFNIDGTFYAIDDTCTDRGGPLSEGMVVGAELTCPWHGAVFDVTSGAVLGAPAPRDIIEAAMPPPHQPRISAYRKNARSDDAYPRMLTRA
jgi:nitrite reductase (NADH) small subunit